MTELDFETLFKMQMDGMKFNQCHPDTKLDKYWVIKIILAFGPYIMYFFLLLNTLKYYLIRNEFFHAFRNSVPITFFICMMFYYISLIAKRSTLGDLIKCVKSDYAKAADMDARRKAVIIENANKGRRIMRIWGYLMVNSVLIFLVKCMFLTAYHSKKLGGLKLIPFHEMHYPLNITERREHNYFIFTGTFIGELYFSTISVSIYFCTLPLGPVFMLHTCGQLELIKIKFESIFEDDNVNQNLNEIVQNLRYIYSFVKDINECFTLIYEVMLKQNMLLLPFTSYAMIQSISHGDLTIEYVGIFFQTLFTSSLPCYYGDLLLQKGEEVRVTAYECGWEKVYIPKARKTLLIILTRALQPVAIETIFSTICLDTLTNVYRQAYTIFNLMTAMW